MTTHNVGIIINGATGRIASTQHIANALGPIRAEGGLAAGSDRIVPQLVLVGRNTERLAAIAAACGAEWTTDLAGALADPARSVFFDAAATHQRQAAIKQAVAAGKHVYSEKPVATSFDHGRELLAAIRSRGLKHGAVEDKLYLPGLQKLLRLTKTDFFGRVTGFRVDFGWWVFDGTAVACQRPSWNYKRKEGGGLILDMFPHWRYVLEGLLGPIRRLTCSMATAVPERIDERGERYAVDVDDQATALLEMESGATGTIIASWATRVRRDDLLTIQIDGTKGSAVAGLHRCWTMAAAQTPHTAHFSIAKDLAIDYRAQWTEVPQGGPYTNPYRVGWENFLRHVATGAPMNADFAAGLRDVAFAEACYRSVSDGGWTSLPPAS